MFNFLNNIGPTELIIIVVILLVIFGAKLMVGIARTSGETVKEIKRVKKVFTESLKDNDEKPSKS